MAGIRIRHPELSSCMVTIPMQHRPFGAPMGCSACHQFHPVKTYHLRLDENGAVIVSQEVFEKLQEVRLAGFVMENVVETPPPITLDMNGRQERFNVVPLAAESKGV